MSTAYPQHIHIVLFTTTLQCILALLFIYASFTQCDIFSQLLPNSLYNNVYSIYSTYTYSTVYNYTIQYTVCAFTYASFSQCDIFSQSLHNWHYNNVYSISLTYIYSTVYNYTTQYTVCAFYICFLYTMWYFFTITAQLTLQQCLQHILNIYIQYCLQLHYPVDWLCCLHMLPFHNMIFFHNYCPIDSTTMFTAYRQHMHTVLFTITLPSRLTLLFTYVILFTMWYFFTITAQLALHQCLQHIRNIYI